MLRLVYGGRAVSGLQSGTTHDAGSAVRILWLSALGAETAPIVSLLGDAGSSDLAGHACRLGDLRGDRVCVAVSGAGDDACRRTLTALLDHLPEVRVVVVGVAGAIGPELEIGDVVLASEAASWPLGDPARQAARVWGATAGSQELGRRSERTSSRPFRVVSGRILSWPEPVQDPRLKARLGERYGADCVDMETGAAARVCAERSVPFLAIRAIADRADGRMGESHGEDFAVAVWHATIVAIRALRPGAEEIGRNFGPSAAGTGARS